MRSIFRISALALAQTIGNCGPVGLAHLSRMVSEANLIVVAQVVQGGQSGSVATVTLEVRKTLRGKRLLVL